MINLICPGPHKFSWLAWQHIATLAGTDLDLHYLEGIQGNLCKNWPNEIIIAVDI